MSSTFGDRWQRVISHAFALLSYGQNVMYSESDDALREFRRMK